MFKVPNRPSRRGTRPSAFQVSFPNEDSTSTTTTGDESTTTFDASRKRDRGDGDGADLRHAKRRNIDTAPLPARKYETRPYEIAEKDLILFGEEPDPPDDGKKRKRVLSHFTFYNAEDKTMVSLDILGEGMLGDHNVRGAGFVFPKYEVDEDEGQEDDIDEGADRQYIRMSRIRRFFTRYWDPDSPFSVETDYAIYEIDELSPSKRYRRHFRHFWRQQTILRSVISSAAQDPDREYSDFLREYCRMEVLGQPMTEQELWDEETRHRLRKTLETIPRVDSIRKSSVINHLLHHVAPVIFKPIGKETETEPRFSVEDFRFDAKGNLDLAVLHAKIPTHVTPLIAEMAVPYFREKLQVVGPRPRQAKPDIPEGDLRLRLQGFLQRVQTRHLIQFRPDQRIGRTYWLAHVLIDGVRYEVGDTVVFYAGEEPPPTPNSLPPTDTLADHFWFAKIIYMHEYEEIVHVQWFQHRSKTSLQEIGQNQELFLTNACDTLWLKHIIGKVNVNYIQPDQSPAAIRPHDFFYRYMWEEHEGSFTDVDVDALATVAKNPPSENCPACEVRKQFDEGKGPTKIHLGVRSYGVDYHLDDCVLIKVKEGPCDIGQIVKLHYTRGEDHVQVQVRLFERTDNLRSRPERVLRDEKHLFYTNVERTVGIDDLVGMCYVMIQEDMPDGWLDMSPLHFYVKYRFRSLADAENWGNRRRMHWADLPACRMCIKQSFKKATGMKAFLEREEPLRVFDPFGGTGAFGLAMEDLGCFKLTHAVDISPSAAKTLRKNAPNVKVYNQCCNLFLRHMILTNEGKDPSPLESVEGKQLPPPPKPGDIDCIIAGFPCQPHSSMNMYQKANDRKSNLILTALSVVDHLRPPYCILENVRGFLKFSLRAHQVNKYSVKGGIPMGGLKFVVAALLDMGYQVRFSLLQAAHYGTPQRRVRFFLIAAKHGLELPKFPQPTHDFPNSDALELKFPGGFMLSPITALSGVAPHRYVSVHDAISDLPKFDWKESRKNLSKQYMRDNHIKECRSDDPWCGYEGPDVPYEHEPRTRFQLHCRRRPTKDIQHYTRTYQADKVDRIIKIPVEPDADFRSLPSEYLEYQTANPQSAIGRAGYRGAKYYGRVQNDGLFQTTVTNVDPMAKQCQVLHPHCKRIVTVRELARSQGFPDHFVFHADGNRVLTMHRQIGNAIPWQVSVAIAREFRESLYKRWEKANPVEEPREVEFSDSGGDDRRM